MESEALPVLRKFEVTYYRNQDWCRAFFYAGGSFAANNVETCTLSPKGVPAFSPAAETAFAEIEKVLEHSGSSVHIIRRAAGGYEFVPDCFGCGTYYFYVPAYTLPSDIPGERLHYPLNENWYRVQQDWN